MSVNTEEHGSKAFALLRGEKLLTPGYAAEVELRVPATIEGPKRVENAAGLIWITSERFVVISQAPQSDSQMRVYDRPPTLSSLVVPYATIKSNDFSVPLFSANHLLVSFVPDGTPTSGLPSPGRGGVITAKLVVGDGQAHAVWKRIEAERAASAERKRHEEALRGAIHPPS
ncbi:uncharacterized protein LOC62_01G000451 [Vanrija pseudolonga]|uniref:Uncharacterized protein n=1 Tax=Vanrija pseudolonga TaxID=143232 RepID=A0AAF0Y3A2_9TREE|nr:hypothetical protein LOC62_01G000451 [Vanrija pseudolonga]